MLVNVSECFFNDLLIGRTGENDVTEVQFDFSKWAKDYGENGTFYLTARPPGATVSYPAEVTVDGTVATWTVKNSDLAVKGYGQVEAWYSIDEKVKASAIYKTYIGESLDESGEIPDPYESWMEDIIALKNQTISAAEDANEAAAEAEGYKQAAEEARDQAEEALDQTESSIVTALRNNLKFVDANNDGNIEILITGGQAT